MNPIVEALGRPLRLAMIGGAEPSMIGPVQRIAAVMDGRFAIVAGVLSSNPHKGRTEGPKLGIAPDRSYGSLEEMLDAEPRRSDPIEAVAIVTPNDSHHRIAKAAIASGLDVIIDKPLTNTVADAEDLAADVARSGVAFCVTHAYAGYPMVRQARAMVAAGEIGEIRMVHVEYFGAGLAAKVEDSPDAARRWRLNPTISGPSLVLGDIGTHAHHLARFITGQEIARLSAEVATLMPGRQVTDYAQARFHLTRGAPGTLTACQGSAGAENIIQIRVFGSKGHLEWRHTVHNELRFAPLEGFPQTLSRGHPMLSAAATRATRIRRTGHPEGLHEAFANLYADFAEAVVARRLKRALDPLAADFPNVRDGVAGVRFVHAALESSSRNGAWVDLTSA
jgi:predicted dehydrogenase